MDIDALVSEIIRRVQEKMETMDGINTVETADILKKLQKEDTPPGILILANTHGTSCHQTLECRQLGKYYRTECALMKNYECNMADYEAVIAYTFTNEALGKIANGIFDDGYTRLFGEALLSGKKIFIPEEEVELYRCRSGAPAVYYEKIESGLKLLLDSGVVVAKKEEIQKMLLKDPGVEKRQGSCCEQKDVREDYLFKHVITEKDIAAAERENVEMLIVDQKAILTDLAQEYAAKRKIMIVRKELSSVNRGQRR